MNNYEAKQAARRERLLNQAEKARGEAAEARRRIGARREKLLEREEKARKSFPTTLRFSN